MESGNLISTQMFVESYIDKDACKFSGKKRII